jgi:hypothetical protein
VTAEVQEARKHERRGNGRCRCCGRRYLGSPDRLRRVTRERPGAEGPERIAPPDGPSQGKLAILQGSISARRRKARWTANPGFAVRRSGSATRARPRQATEAGPPHRQATSISQPSLLDAHERASRRGRTHRSDLGTIRIGPIAATATGVTSAACRARDVPCRSGSCSQQRWGRYRAAQPASRGHSSRGTVRRLPVAEGTAARLRGLTLPNVPAYHPRDDERADALTGARRVCVPLGIVFAEAQRPDGEDHAELR